jgi:chemotaxis protein methyltransferase CheR
MPFEIQMLDQIRTQVYLRAGIRLQPEKDYYLNRILKRRLSALALDNFRDYFRLLTLDVSGRELGNLIEEITINETYFFRDYPQLSEFAEKVLPFIAEEKLAKEDRSIRILSVGCSTGEEPYTLAIICRELLDNPDQWQLDVSGVDINSQVVGKARKGRYDIRSTRDVPISYKSKYFDREDNTFVVRDELRSLVHFSQGNLIDANSLSRYSGSDVVFCRNVLIYFDQASRRNAMSNLYECLKPGGFILLGYAESVGRFTGAFEMTRIDGFIVYRRPIRHAETSIDS